jgi:hypothetical protein
MLLTWMGPVLMWMGELGPLVTLCCCCWHLVLSVNWVCFSVQVRLPHLLYVLTLLYVLMRPQQQQQQQ